MSARPEQIDVVRQWVDKADNDLTMGEDCPLDTVCFMRSNASRNI